MKKIFLYSTIALSLLSSLKKVTAQSDIKEINFTFVNVLRIPNHSVEIKISHYKDSVEIKAKSTCSNKDTAFTKLNVDHSFTISPKQFNDIIDLINKIKSSDITSNFNTEGFDGDYCDIEFGGLQNKIKYSVWSPDYGTSRRNLKCFLDACKLILTTAKFNADEILDNSKKVFR